jgi:hypothetical protein
VKLPDDHPIHALDRLVEQRFGPPMPVDPVQVQGKLHAYLTWRGRQVARDLDMPQTSDENLAELGRLDCIDQNPNMSPGLAPYVEMIADERDGKRWW